MTSTPHPPSPLSSSSTLSESLLDPHNHISNPFSSFDQGPLPDYFNYNMISMSPTERRTSQDSARSRVLVGGQDVAPVTQQTVNGTSISVDTNNDSISSDAQSPLSNILPGDLGYPPEASIEQPVAIDQLAVTPPVASRKPLSPQNRSVSFLNIPTTTSAPTSAPRRWSRSFPFSLRKRPVPITTSTGFTSPALSPPPTAAINSDATNRGSPLPLRVKPPAPSVSNDPETTLEQPHISQFEAVTPNGSGVELQTVRTGKTVPSSPLPEMQNLSTAGTLIGSPGWDRPYQEYNSSYGQQSTLTVPEGDEMESSDFLNERSGLYTSHEHEHENHNDRKRLPETAEQFARRFSQAPLACSTHQNVKKRRRSWIFGITLFLSVLSTILSSLWMIVAFLQPRWGDTIMTSSRGQMTPSTASFICALISKIIELSFVTVFVTVVGQELTARAINAGGSITLADMAVRNWVIQPGSLITNWEVFPWGIRSIIGVLTVLATICATLYTTASQVMIDPKLRYGSWEKTLLQGQVKSSYGNVAYVRQTCENPLLDVDPGTGTQIGTDDGMNTAERSCLNIKNSGMSHRNFEAWLAEWAIIHENGWGRDPNDKAIEYSEQGNRPVAKGMLYDNVTLTGQWIDTDAPTMTELYLQYGRVINNVSLAMPHPGIYEAATSNYNKILQPDDLSGVGEYQLRAAVIAPIVNTLCVDMEYAELAPLVWALDKNFTNVTAGSTALVDEEKFNVYNSDTSEVHYTPTVVDDIFKWGENYTRMNGGKARPHPYFEVVPETFNAIVDHDNVPDAIYILTKPYNKTNLSSTYYSLCELKSKLYFNCSTHFNISGTSGAHLSVLCDDPDEKYTYWNSLDGQDRPWMRWDTNWRDLAWQWALAIDLGSGLSSGNASNARVWSELGTFANWNNEITMSSILPTMAEALTVIVSSTLLTGTLDTPFSHWWDYPSNIISPVKQTFNATIKRQEYTSAPSEKWQNVFYLILILTVILNIICLLYILFHKGLLTDFTEPQNMFALALNSPPSHLMNGSCGGGPGRKQLVVPFRVEYQEDLNHFYYTEVPGQYQQWLNKKTKPVESPRQSYMKAHKKKRPMSWASYRGGRMNSGEYEEV